MRASGSINRRRAITAAALVLVAVALLVFPLRGGGGARSGSGPVPPGSPPATGAQARAELEAPCTRAGLAAEDAASPALSAPAEAAQAGAPRVPVTPDGLHGRVVDAATGAPLAGVAIERSFAGSIDHRSVSGSDGAFAFASRVTKHGSLSAVLAGWRFEPSKVVLTKLAGDEVEFEGKLIQTAPLRGRLVDARTGEPVPRYPLAFEDVAGAEARVTTDDDGRFETAALELGGVKVRLLEGGDELALEHGAQGAPAEHELAVQVGPTFFFDLDKPADVATQDLSVGLLDPAPIPSWSLMPDDDEAPAEPVFRIDLGRDLPSSAAYYGCPRGPDIPLRTDGDPAWVRLPPIDPDDWPMPEADGYRLLVFDEQGHRAGAGRAPALIGIQEQRIPIRIEPLCTLAGRVSDAQGQRVEHAVVRLCGGALPRPLACISDRDGDFDFGVPPGRYELSAEGRRGAAGPRSVVLDGPEVQLELELEPHPTIEVAGTIRGGRSGLLDEFAAIELRSLSDPRLRFAPDVEPAPGVEGEVAASFRFGAVPAGDYELLAEPYMGMALEPSRILIDRSRTDLLLACRDDFETARVEFLLLDTEGAAIEDGLVLCWVEGEHRPIPPEEMGSDMGRAAFTLPAGASVRWVAAADGCLPAEGVWSAGAPGGDPVEVRMERGHAFSILVLDPWLRGVDEAELLIDGAAAGRTNELGYGIFPAQEAPASVRVRKPGWADILSLADLEDGVGLFVLAPEG